MAANFWASSHCKRWMFQSSELERRRVRYKGSFDEDELDILEFTIMGFMHQIGERLGFRQAVVATAKLLYKRFYVMATLDDFDPRLMMVTSLYLGAKVEEMGQFSVNRVLSKVREVVHAKGLAFPSYTAQHVHDYEFHLLEKLSFDLVVFHPYPHLLTYVQDAKLNADCLNVAWGIINDSYETDAILLYPPYLVALGALYLACVHLDVDVKEWYNRLNVKSDDIREITKMILDMYQKKRRVRLEQWTDQQQTGLKKWTEKRQTVLAKVDKKYEKSLREQKREHDKRSKEQLHKNKNQKLKK